ncbi:hypothetical protein [uncultured Jannaschia sp.]|uniref:hypothetical protein n=1 Tax=uncultured Jannaschia sp. TaxID=293347 RepID=UPI0026022D2A|nr:hypothetical protein [uncultured Jannaschia sp.]
MSVLTPCSSKTMGHHGGLTRTIAAPLIGALLAGGLWLAATSAAPFWAEPNSHFTPERLAEVAKMLAAQ